MKELAREIKSIVCLSEMSCLGARYSPVIASARGNPLPQRHSHSYTAPFFSRVCGSPLRSLHQTSYLRTWPLPSAASGADTPANSEHYNSDSWPPPVSEGPERKSFWGKWQSNAAETRAQVAKLGFAAILAYGLFDGITYTIFFILAFLGYEKSTGKNPAANIQALLGIVILMWTGNNVTRPFRVAGAAALAPFIDKALRKLQRALNLPNQFFTFMVVVATFASLCFSIVGLLILSRWGK